MEEEKLATGVVIRKHRFTNKDLNSSRSDLLNGKGKVKRTVSKASEETLKILQDMTRNYEPTREVSGGLRHGLSEDVDLTTKRERFGWRGIHRGSVDFNGSVDPFFQTPRYMSTVAKNEFLATFNGVESYSPLIRTTNEVEARTETRRTSELSERTKEGYFGKFARLRKEHERRASQDLGRLQERIASQASSRESLSTNREETCQTNPPFHRSNGLQITTERRRVSSFAPKQDFPSAREGFTSPDLPPLKRSSATGLEKLLQPRRSKILSQTKNKDGTVLLVIQKPDFAKTEEGEEGELARFAKALQCLNVQSPAKGQRRPKTARQEFLKRSSVKDSSPSRKEELANMKNGIRIYGSELAKHRLLRAINPPVAVLKNRVNIILAEDEEPVEEFQPIEADPLANLIVNGERPTDHMLKIPKGKKAEAEGSSKNRRKSASEQTQLKTSESTPRASKEKKKETCITLAEYDDPRHAKTKKVPRFFQNNFENY